MVFGWGKKKTRPERAIEAAAESPERDISLGQIGKILDELEEIRSRTLIAEVSSFGKRISPQFDELREIAIQLEKDSLKVDDIDKHLKTIVERGKKQVIAIIMEETSVKLPQIRAISDAESLNGQMNRSLKKIGDVLGRQTRVIHLFAKKYAGKLKTILAYLEEERGAIQTLLENYKKLQSGISEIGTNVGTIERSKQTLKKKSRRIAYFESSLGEFEEKLRQIAGDIDEIKASKEYSRYLKVQEQLGQLGPEKNALRREINDQFTKISRPLGKYEYVSSLDKEQKSLLGVLVESPFEAISSQKKGDIITIIQSVKKGVISGSVSVKDADKSIQFLDETTELLDSLIRQKEAFLAKEDALKDQLASFDLDELRKKESELQKTAANNDDAKSKIVQLRAEISEITQLVPKLTADIERTLREVSSTKYVIKAENS